MCPTLARIDKSIELLTSITNKRTEQTNIKDPRNKSLLAISASDRNTLQMLLVAFIEEGSWIHLKWALAIRLFVDAARSLHEHTSLFGANILHIALCNQPPIDVIYHILQFPDAIPAG
mmetsp:Transcript_5637/g.12825  ORF Transcript_5637/g.12825 Transcript_5637/m.12825 type:complete len:118 (-) Transcript_5637:268-621(-)